MGQEASGLGNSMFSQMVGQLADLTHKSFQLMQTMQEGLKSMQNKTIPRPKTTGKKDYSSYWWHLCEELGHIKYQCHQKNVSGIVTTSAEFAAAAATTLTPDGTHLEKIEG